jgi:hypothetical protein
MRGHRQAGKFLWDITYLCWNLTDIEAKGLVVVTHHDRH